MAENASKEAEEAATRAVEESEEAEAKRAIANGKSRK